MILLYDIPDKESTILCSLLKKYKFAYQIVSTKDECLEKLLNEIIVCLIVNDKILDSEPNLLDTFKFYSNQLQFMLFMETDKFEPSIHLRENYIGVIEKDNIDTNAFLQNIKNSQRLYLLSQKNETQNIEISNHLKITDELSLERTVLERERNFNDSIISSISYGLLIVDTLGDTLIVNEPGKKIYGISGGDFLGSNYIDIIDPSFVKALKIGADFVLKNNSTHYLEAIVINDSLIVTLSVSVITDNFKNVLGIMFLCRDITDSETMKEQLIQSEKLATMGTMLSGIAHELRNPITIINARAQRLLVSKKEKLSEKVEKSVKSIEEQSTRCGEIVNNLLSFARKSVSTYENNNINEIIKESIAFFEFEGKGDDISFSLNLENECVTCCDKSQMQQIFLNLITNAADAMNYKGNIIISTKVCDTQIQMEFKDDGPGMTEEVQKKIFDPFFTTKEAGKGTGLGLAIVLKMIQSHKGYISMKSELEIGTTFNISLPLVVLKREM